MQTVAFNDFLRRSNLTEFVLWSLLDGNLRLLGSDDMSYYHQIEFLFEGVIYIDAPVSFWDPRVRVATEEERLRFIQCKALPSDTGVFVIEDRSDTGTVQYFVAAAGASTRVGMTYHYERQGLKPGESIAPWVRAS